MSLKTVKQYPGVREYNAEHPDLPFPTRHELDYDYTAIMLAVEHGDDDVRIDFIPGGADGDETTVGNLVARSYSGRGPVFLLAEGVERYPSVAAILSARKGSFMTLEEAASAGAALQNGPEEA